jgi:hypothetical protein
LKSIKINFALIKYKCPAGQGTKQEKKKGKTLKSMEREYTARNGMEESTTRGLGE